MFRFDRTTSRSKTSGSVSLKTSETWTISQANVCLLKISKIYNYFIISYNKKGTTGNFLSFHYPNKKGLCKRTVPFSIFR